MKQTITVLNRDYILYNDGRLAYVNPFPQNGINFFKKQTPSGKGYLQYKFYEPGKRLNGKTIKIHRLVAETFIPNPENKPEVNHIDGDKTNNHVSNLEWCTHVENMAHAKENGLMVGNGGLKGVQNPHAKLNESVVKTIRINRENLTQKELAKKHNVSKGTISLIVNKKIWQHV